MTVINPSSDIPSSITTLEQLAAWSLLALQSINNEVLIQESAGAAPELIVSANPFRILADPADYHERLLTRLSLRLQEDWYTKKLWLAAEEISTDTLPAVFRQV